MASSDHTEPVAGVGTIQQPTRTRLVGASITAAAVWLAPIYALILFSNGAPGDRGMGIGIALLWLPVVIVAAAASWLVLGRYLISRRLFKLRHHLLGALAVAAAFAAVFSVVALLRGGGVQGMLFSFGVMLVSLGLAALPASCTWWYIGARPYASSSPL